MSIEFDVLFHGALPRKAALDQCLKDLGFPLSTMGRLDQLERLGGLLPLRFRREACEVGFNTRGGREELERLVAAAVDTQFTRVVRAFTRQERATAVACLAAALARLTDGMVFDPQTTRLMSVEEAIAAARQWLKDTSLKTGPSTRQADIKQYLKPLLRQRSDLVLIRRLLLARPVRHVLRGARIDRVPDKEKYELRVGRYLAPLYAEYPDGVGYDGYSEEGLLEVWQPHFVPLLTNLLATDIFEEQGSITTMSGLAEQFLGGTGLPAPHAVRDAWIVSLVLAGEADRAAAAVEHFDRVARSAGFAGDPIKPRFEDLVKDVDALCAACHAKEAVRVKVLKLEHIWEPSPFPVEVPAAQRAARSDEPLLPVTPWPARPPWLWAELPKHPDDVRFARKLVHRVGKLKLLVALTRHEAEERHRASEGYVLAARLPDGMLVLITYSTPWDRHLPDELPYRLTPRDEPSIWVELYGSSHTADGSIECDDRVGMMRFESFSAGPLGSPRSWQCGLLFDRDIKSIGDLRSIRSDWSNPPLTAAERELATFAKPEFGAYADIADRLRSLLGVTGYGVVA